MSLLTDPQIWLSLATLTALEIVLGIENVVFISILAGKLPPALQPRARRTGLALALITRILLLCTITWMMKLTAPLFMAFGQPVSGKDLILIAGGLFLIAKTTHEIHGRLEGAESTGGHGAPAGFTAVVVQIMLLDVVFSLDSVITAVGVADVLGVMIAAVVLAMLVMLAAVGTISDFVNRHPTVKMLPLGFLLLTGVMLVADGCGQHIPKGYIYFAMAFSVGIELLNLKAGRQAAAPVALHTPHRPEP